jgi:hypothetical protein
VNFLRRSTGPILPPKPPREIIRPTQELARLNEFLITPEQAEVFMEYNTLNRPESGDKSGQYSDDMADGCFLYNYQPIIFDRNLTLLDGQTRLRACMESGIPFKSDIVFGADPKIRPTVDIGRTRTLKHMLDMEKRQPHTTAAAALANMLLLHRRHGIASLNNNSKRPTKPAAKAALDAGEFAFLDEAIRWSRSGLKSLVKPPRVIGFTYHIFAEQDKDTADRFFSALAAEANLAADSPVLILLKRLRGKPVSVLESIALFFKAWVKFRDGEACQQLRWSEAEPFPSIEMGNRKRRVA